jgi:pyruvate-formate lyase-activating enzyme
MAREIQRELTNNDTVLTLLVTTADLRRSDIQRLLQHADLMSPLIAQYDTQLYRTMCRSEGRK